MPYQAIRYSSEVKSRCRAALHGLLPSLRLQLQPSVKPNKGEMPKDQAFSLQIQQSGSTKQWLDKGHDVTYVLAPLSHAALPNPLYWFAVKLDFSPSAGDHILTQATILILRGEGTPQPFVRAEWDNSEQDGKHAQPHWHIYGSHLEPKEYIPADPVVNTPAMGQPAVKLQRIHYAMASTWHVVGDKPAKSHWKALETDDQLASWISGCLQYLITQLIYFEKKSAAAAGSAEQLTFGV
jgi:hypothetical protein